MMIKTKVIVYKNNFLFLIIPVAIKQCLLANIDKFYYKFVSNKNKLYLFVNAKQNLPVKKIQKSQSSFIYLPKQLLNKITKNNFVVWQYDNKRTVTATVYDLNTNDKLLNIVLKI